MYIEDDAYQITELRDDTVQLLPTGMVYPIYRAERKEQDVYKRQEYPMPDEQVSTPDMQEYGYSYDGMLPVTRERALELDAAGLTVYVLHEDNTESMVFDPQEIMAVSYTHLDGKEQN